MRKIILPVAAAALFVTGTAGIAAADTTPADTGSQSCQAYTDAQQQLATLQGQLGDAQSQLATVEQQVRDLNAAKNTAQQHADDLAAQVRVASADKIKNQQALPGLQTALDAATQARGIAANDLRNATNAAAGAADDITLRQGYIAAFQAKYATAQTAMDAAQTKLAADVRQLAKSPTNGKLIARVADDHAAIAAIQATLDHYGPASQATQQSHIDHDQALLDTLAAAQAKMDDATATRGAAASAVQTATRAIDADTALGQKLYPQYQAALAAVADAQTQGSAAYKQVLTLRGQVTDFTGKVTDAQTALGGVVCPTDPDQGSTGTTPGDSGQDSDGGTASDPTGAGASDPARVTTAAVTTTTPSSVTAPSARRPVVIADSAVQSALRTPSSATTGVAPASLAETGASDALPWIAAGGLVVLASGAAMWIGARRSTN